MPNNAWGKLLGRYTKTMNSERSLKEQAEALGLTGALNPTEPSQISLGWQADADGIDHKAPAQMIKELPGDKLDEAREWLHTPDSDDEETRGALQGALDLLIEEFSRTINHGNLEDPDGEEILVWKTKEDLADPALFATALLHKMGVLTPVGFEVRGL